ncbi:MAG TPA: ABC transporter permease [Thermoanaerobaculia bacterium]|jgi:ABC-type antimicrobial peptide transport system permease subunit|nr:ABC transporter permease [Thermoanaerobaculia bacterium]
MRLWRRKGRGEGGDEPRKPKRAKRPKVAGSKGSFRERLQESWIELKESPGRSFLQALGVMLGVASVLGGFSIADSQRQQTERIFARIGGIDKLNVLPKDVVNDGTPSALQTANLGLRLDDANRGELLPTAKGVNATSIQKQARARVRSEFTDEERDISGIGADYIAMNGYEIEEGRSFSTNDMEIGAPVAILGRVAAADIFPTGEIVGKQIRIGDIPVTVIGVFREKVFRFREGQQNIFAWRNRIVAVPAALISNRMQGDDYNRLQRITFRIPDLKAMTDFSKELQSLVTVNHRLQDDFRLDDVKKRLERQLSQGQVYNVIFMLSGVLALIGGGMVNVNIQLASLKERVREVGVKMALGASGREIFKSFMTEALLLTLLGAVSGYAIGIAFSWTITKSIGIPLALAPKSFILATAMAVVFGFLFALYPAAKASRQSPMEALRYE